MISHFLQYVPEIRLDQSIKTLAHGAIDSYRLRIDCKKEMFFFHIAITIFFLITEREKSQFMPLCVLVDHGIKEFISIICLIHGK